MYAYAGKKKSMNYGKADVNRMTQKMANEMVSLRKELADTRARLNALETG